MFPFLRANHDSQFRGWKQKVEQDENHNLLPYILYICYRDVVIKEVTLNVSF